MSGNNSRFLAVSLFLILAFILSANQSVYATTRIPAKNFRFGLAIEAGAKFVGPSGFYGRTGFILKFNEKTSLIPYIGMYPDEYTESYSYTYRNSTEYYEEYYEEPVIDAGLTIRFEFPKEIVQRSTAFEYNLEEQDFVHQYYYSAFRPFAQVHLGTFLGGGFGFLYYFSGTTAIGLSADVGYNLAVESGEGFGVIPKFIVGMAF